jgi:hypothetical protein
VLLYFNFFAIRDITFDFLRDIPVVGRLIPDITEPPHDPYAGMTMEQVIAQNQRLERDNERLQNDLSASRELNTARAQEIAQLLEIAEDIGATRILKDEVDRAIFENAPPSAFIGFFEAISPHNLELFYPEAVRTQEEERRFRNYYNLIRLMDERAAARALEVLIPTDMWLVEEIITELTRLNVAQTALILEQMTDENRALMMKFTHPSP